MSEKWHQKFHEFTQSCKDFAWWGFAVLGVFGGVGTILHQMRGKLNLAAIIAAAVVAIIGVVVAIWRLHVYRRKWRRHLRASKYLHSLAHVLRDTMSKDGIIRIVGSRPETNSGEPLTLARKKVLQDILDLCAHAFRKITGDSRCTASLLMPTSETELSTVLYCSDVDPERKNGSKPQTGGLAWLAFKAPDAKVHSDYARLEKEGHFERTRDDWEKWYRSGIMAHFKIAGQPWGMLNVDSPNKNTFHPDQKDIACTFADACSIICGLGSY